MQRIVVGVDGSEASMKALRWALDEARLRNAEVDVLQSWHYPTMTYAPGFVPPPTFARQDLIDEATEDLRAACSAVGTDGVTVHPMVAEGPAARWLIERAEGADLLVVGSRGRGGFSGLVLGSVSQQCAQHAPCPVVIVH